MKKNRLIAEILGLPYNEEGSTINPSTGLVEDFLPTTNLQQAIDYIMPWLRERKIHHVRMDIFHGRAEAKLTQFIIPMIEARGEGNTSCERLADALCSVFLEVANEK